MPNLAVFPCLCRLVWLAATAMLVVALAPAVAHAAPDQVMTFEAPRELLLDGERETALDEIAALGVDRVRQLVYWKDYAPAPAARRRPSGFRADDPAEYPAARWAKLDNLFTAAGRRGISVQLTLTGPGPRWATRSRRDGVTNPRPEEFQAFAEAVGRRYGDRVAVWSIWNEPNHPDFLQPQYDAQDRPVSPRLYRRLYLAGERGLEAAGNGDDTILLGETAPNGGSRVVAPLAFLRGTLCLNASYRRVRACARLDADGYAHHAYTKRQGPTYRPDTAERRDWVTIGVLSRLTRALDRAARARAIRPRLGVYLTEFGIQSVPDCFAGVSLTRQAEFLAISERLAYYNPRVKAFSQYLLADDRPRAGVSGCSRYAGFETGLRRADGRAKPALDGFRLPLVVTEYGISDVLWGRVRPARGRTTVVIEARTATRWQTVGRVTTNAAAVWGARVRHRTGQRLRVRWTAPDGRTYTGPAVRPS